MKVAEKGHWQYFGVTVFRDSQPPIQLHERFSGRDIRDFLTHYLSFDLSEVPPIYIAHIHSIQRYELKITRADRAVFKHVAHYSRAVLEKVIYSPVYKPDW